MNNNITHIIFDWGDTLMVDDPKQSAAMAHWDSVCACDGVTPLLPKLSAKYTCAVASNAEVSDSALMRKAFERVDLAQYLTYYVVSKELGAKKPSHEFFRRVVTSIGAEPQNCVMIGNSYANDICGAKTVGMATVLITNEPGEYPLADYVIGHFSELGGIFL